MLSPIPLDVVIYHRCKWRDFNITLSKLLFAHSMLEHVHIVETEKKQDW